MKLCNELAISLDKIFEQCPLGIVCKNSKLEYISVNKTYCDIFSIPNHFEIIGERFNKFLNKTEQEIAEKTNEEICKTLSPLKYVINIKENKYISVISSPIIKNGEFQGIITFVKDITQEEELKEKLVNKHCQLKALMENIPQIIYMQNDKLEYVIGTKQSKKFLKNGHDEIEKITIKNFNDSTESEYVLKNNSTLISEHEYLGTDGRYHRYRLKKAPVKDYNNNITGIITLASNIDSERDLQTQRETFVASIGHDLKNPTIAQIRMLELLLKNSFGALNPEQKELLEMVLDSCLYMRGMLASLLDTYRNYNGAVKMKFTDFSLYRLVQDCIAEMKYVGKDKNIEISLDTDIKEECNKAKSFMVLADKIQIRRVIMNLLSNGIKYAYNGSILRLKLSDKKKGISFEFENESPYITSKVRENLFSQYASFTDTKKELGIGLGLYASKRIVESHHGEIYVKSFKDNRNVFGFIIPKIQDLNCEKEIFF